MNKSLAPSDRPSVIPCLGLIQTQARHRARAAMNAPHSKKQAGVVAVMVALLLPVLLGLGAFAVDFGYRFVVRAQLQNAADATALAAAACLLGRAQCGNANATAPDWTTASQKAVSYVSSNAVANVPLSDVTVSYGYWNTTGSPAGLQALPLTPGANDLAAIRVTISKQSGKNGGAAQTFLAPVLGVYSMPVSATAVAVIAYPSTSGVGNLFPVAVTKCMYDNYWDSATRKPKTATSSNPPGFDLPQTIGQAYVFKVTSSYHAGSCESGQWTSLNINSNNVPTIRDLIANGNSADIPIGGSIWIQPGTKTTLYSSVNDCSAAGDKSCEYAMVPVVDLIGTHAYNPVRAFACMRILSATGGSGKYIVMQMSANTEKCQTGGASGGGPAYGQYVPPRLVF